MRKVAVSKIKRKRVEKILPALQEPMGLCTCCKVSQTCTFITNPGQAVLQCEEFDGILPTPSKTPLRARTTIRIPKKTSSNRYKGLCSLCRDRLACTFPKPEGGVWHCEEYR